MQRRAEASATVAGVNGDLFTWADGILERADPGRRSRTRRTRSARCSAWTLPATCASIGSRCWAPGRAPARDGRSSSSTVHQGQTGPRSRRPTAGRRRPATACSRPFSRRSRPRRRTPTWSASSGEQAAGRRSRPAAPCWRREDAGPAHGRRSGDRGHRQRPTRPASGMADVPEALGGGPELIRQGRPIFRPAEDFGTYHLNRRHPRTAVGQRTGGS